MGDQITSVLIERRDVVRLEGPDAASFLHGQSTQDVEGLEVGSWAWNLVLSPVGKVVGHGRTTKVADDVLLMDVEAGSGSGLVARLGRFRLRVDVDISSTEVAAARLMGGDLTDDDLVDVDGGLLDQIERLPDGPEQRWILGESVSAAGVAVAPDVVEAARIRSARPRMGAELVPDESIPNESRSLVAECVSFTKGCYVGQELVARLDARGDNTPMRIVALASDSGRGDHEPPRALVNPAGDDAGVLTSVAAVGSGAVALARIRRSRLQDAVLVADGVQWRRIDLAGDEG